MKNKIFLMCLAGIIASSPAFAQKVGTTSMQFLKVMPSARGTAMGDAYTTVVSGADALFWNPGAAAMTQNPEFTMTYIDWIFDTYQGALAYAAPLGDFGVVGVQAQYVDFGVFEETSASYANQIPGPGLTGREFHPFTYLIGLSYAKTLTDKFSTGLSVKYAHESLYDQNTFSAVTVTGETQKVNTFANALLFDFGLLYNTGYRSIKLGAAVQNFGASVRFARESNPVPLLFRLGISADLIGANSLFVEDNENRLTGSFELFQPNDYTQQIHTGLEYEFAGTFALRAGYKFNYDYEGLTLGAGIKQTIGSVQFLFDYSYVSIGEYLGKVHRISLGVIL